MTAGVESGSPVPDCNGLSIGLKAGAARRAPKSRNRSASMSVPLNRNFSKTEIHPPPPPPPCAPRPLRLWTSPRAGDGTPSVHRIRIPSDGALGGHEQTPAVCNTCPPPPPAVPDSRVFAATALMPPTKGPGLRCPIPNSFPVPRGCSALRLRGGMRLSRPQNGQFPPPISTVPCVSSAHWAPRRS